MSKCNSGILYHIQQTGLFLRSNFFLSLLLYPHDRLLLFEPFFLLILNDSSSSSSCSCCCCSFSSCCSCSCSSWSSSSSPSPSFSSHLILLLLVIIFFFHCVFTSIFSLTMIIMNHPYFLLPLHFIYLLILFTNIILLKIIFVQSYL